MRASEAEKILIRPIGHYYPFMFPLDPRDIERKDSDSLPQPAPGDYCEDAREVAPGVWEWRGRRYYRENEIYSDLFNEEPYEPDGREERLEKLGMPWWEKWLARERLLAESVIPEH